MLRLGVSDSNPARIPRTLVGSTSRRTTGATSVPNSSIERMTLSCGIEPTVNWIRNRSWSKISCWNRIFSLTSAGLPVKLAPCSPRDASYCSRVIGGQPRSRPILSIMTLTDGNDTSAASCESAAMKPCELMLSGGIGSWPAAAAARRKSCANGAKRSGSPPMMASAIGRPRVPARTADSGVPPTAIQIGSGSCSGRG